MKDLFSEQSSLYARYRPLYPAGLYDYLLDLVKNRDVAWDAGTGNGQVAGELSKSFSKVIASDLSEAQLSNAVKKPNIEYIKSDSLLPSIGADTFDLVTIGTALHWFDHEVFYREVKRTAKPGAVIAAWCYNVIRVDKKLDSLIDRFTYEKLGDYWDKERRWVDEKYKTIPFPFEDLHPPEFEIKVHWDLPAFEGYLNTWSSVRHYIKAHGINPVDELIDALRDDWTGTMDATFPLHLRTGRIK